MGEKLGRIDDIDPTEAINESRDLVETVESAVLSYQNKHPALSVHTTLPDQAIVQGDRSILYIVEEVIENAIEHNDKPSGEREIDITIQNFNGATELRVGDNGTGIPEDELSSLSHGVETPLQHTSGVGLWVVTWLTKLVGGELVIDSTIDTGTEISITFQPVTSLEILVSESTTKIPV